MNKNFSISFALLGLFLFSLVSMPKTASNSIRCWAVSSLAPAWSCASSFQQYLLDRPLGKKRIVSAEELHRLQLENQLLKSQLESALDARFAGREISAVAAQVIYRDPSSWSSSLWIDAGQRDSIEKDSPVVVGNSLIGIVDYVGERKSRVRLITDSGISPAVRAARGKIQNRHLLFELQSVQELLGKREDLFASEEEKQSFIKALELVEKRLESKEETLYLAKGELSGSSAPLWRSRRALLKGIGFNFEFLEEEEKRPEKEVILKEGDLLVTSGLDGVFPPGLLVATVISVQKGGYAYELQARPTAKDLNHLQRVYILPRVSKI